LTRVSSLLLLPDSEISPIGSINFVLFTTTGVLLVWKWLDRNKIK
jgi:hypothetical protein